METWIIVLIIVGLLLILGLIAFLLINTNKIDKSDKNILWGDKERPILGMPISTIAYSLTDERLLIKKGFLSKAEDEIRLYRILDIKLSESFGQRIFGLGSIEVNSSDKTMKNFSIKNIKNPREAKELLSSLVEKQRDAKRVFSREYMVDDDIDDYDNDGL